MEPKERILCKAHDLFNRYGFKRVTMDEIALKTGMSKKTIYQLFANKDEIVDAVVEELLSKSMCTCEQNTAKAENAVHEIFLNTEMVEEMLREMNPILYEDMEKFFPAVYAKFFDYKNKYIFQKVYENLKRGIEEGFFREELNIDIIAKFRVATLFIPFSQEIFPYAKYNLAQVEVETLELYLYGISTAEGQELIKKYKQQRIKNN
jgi:AcrR family transcriptional regulator